MQSMSTVSVSELSRAAHGSRVAGSPSSSAVASILALSLRRLLSCRPLASATALPWSREGRQRRKHQLTRHSSLASSLKPLSKPETCQVSALGERLAVAMGMLQQPL